MYRAILDAPLKHPEGMSPEGKGSNQCDRDRRHVLAVLGPLVREPARPAPAAVALILVRTAPLTVPARPTAATRLRLRAPERPPGVLRPLVPIIIESPP